VVVLPGGGGGDPTGLSEQGHDVGGVGEMGMLDAVARRNPGSSAQAPRQPDRDHDIWASYGQSSARTTARHRGGGQQRSPPDGSGVTSASQHARGDADHEPPSAVEQAAAFREFPAGGDHNRPLPVVGGWVWDGERRLGWAVCPQGGE
jgi:hypothetical protein